MAICINLSIKHSKAVNTNMKLTRSEVESEVYNLEFYRAKVETVRHFNELLNQLVSNKVDVLRLKVNAEEKQVFSKLDEIGIPYQLYNMLYTNYVEISDLPNEAFVSPPKYECEDFDPSKMDRMRSMVVRTINKKTWVNYNSDLISDRITDELELQASQEYGCSFYSKDGTKASWIIRFENEDIGFFMGEESEDGFYGAFYGILPEHRNREHSKVVYMMMLDICRKKGYRFFKNDIGVMNIPSQKSASSQRMVPTDIYFHFELYPMLSLKSDKIVVNDSASILPFSEIDDRVLARILNTVGSDFESATKFEHRLVVENKRTAMVVSKGVDDSGQPLGLTYTQWR